MATEIEREHRLMTRMIRLEHLWENFAAAVHDLADLTARRGQEDQQ